MIQVRKHAIVRFRQRVAKVSPQEAHRILEQVASAELPQSGFMPVQHAITWQDIRIIVVIAGTTVLTCWRD